jgi:cytochrome c556
MNASTKLALTACCALAAGSVALSQPPHAAPTPEQRANRAVELRQSVMQVQAYSLRPAAAMLRNAPYDAAAVKQAAARLKMLSAMLGDVFKDDTSKFDIKDAAAKPEVWTDASGFESAINGEVKAVDALDAAVAGGDKDATLTALKAVGKSCGDCHDKFRKKEQG